MKILYVTMQFDPARAQGAERYVAMLIAGLAQRGHEVLVLAGDPTGMARHGFGSRVHASPCVLHLPSHGWTAVHGLVRREIGELLARERPDVVHVVNPAHIGIGAMLEARAASIRTVVTVVDFWWVCPRHTLQHHSGRTCDADVHWLECVRCIAATDERAVVRTISRAPIVRELALPTLYAGRAFLRGAPLADLARWPGRARRLLNALDQADDVIFLSNFGCELIGPRLDHARRHLIPVGLEPRWFAARRTALPSAAPRHPDNLTIGFVGALAEHKGPHLLLEAARQLGWSRMRIVLAGGGHEPRYLERLRGLATGLNVDFRGRVPSDQVPALLATLDLLVVPSIWPENQPQTVLEALATDTPLITSDVAGIREVLADDALLFEPGNAASLAAAIRRWSTHPLPTRPANPIPTVDEMVEHTLRVYRQDA